MLRGYAATVNLRTQEAIEEGLAALAAHAALAAECLQSCRRSACGLAALAGGVLAALAALAALAEEVLAVLAALAHEVLAVRARASSTSLRGHFITDGNKAIVCAVRAAE